MNIPVQDISRLRELTGLPMMECKKALVEARGNHEKAREILRLKGHATASKKKQRSTKSGIIESYIHDGKIGVLVEVLTETDFVARNDQFLNFVKDLTLQIAASNPRYLSPDEIPKKEIDIEKKHLETEAKKLGKADGVAKKIVQGKLEKFYADVCLLNQPFIKDQDRTISDVLNELVAKIGENITISRFVRLSLGEDQK